MANNKPNPTIKKRNDQVVKEFYELKDQNFTKEYIYRTLCGRHSISYELAKLILVQYHRTLRDSKALSIEDVIGESSATNQKITLEIIVRNGK